MAKCNTKLFYGCCPSVTPVDPEDKKPEDKKDGQKPDVQPVPVPTPVPPKPCCHTFKIEHITVVGNEVLVVFDDCTFSKAPITVLDKSVGVAKDEMDKANTEELENSVKDLQEKLAKLAEKEDKDTVYDDSALVKRIEALESKEDKDTIFDPESLIGRITALEGKEDKDTVYDDTAIRNLIEALQNKEDKDTIFDPSALEARIAALESKEDKDTVFNPATLEERITALEGKADKDTVYDDSALAARVKALEDAPAGEKVDTTKFVRKDELVEVQNWAGTTRFKAYPADERPKTVYSKDKL